MRVSTLTPPAMSPEPTRLILGHGAILSLPGYINPQSKVVILSDAGIPQIAEAVHGILPTAHRISVPAGDASKSLVEVERMTGEMLAYGCDRQTALVCVGGGMVTDLGGFLGSIFMRGIAVILIPTTLLGMVDASIGGKNAVNVRSRKNVIGTIMHPKAVLIDTSLLRDVPALQFAQGLAEIIKIAAMIDRPFFEWLERELPSILRRDDDAVTVCVSRAIDAKVRVVESDDRDRDVRLLLNFGHTVGHAIEACDAYRISHGDAVSIGMCVEMRLAASPLRSRVEALLAMASLPTTLPPSLDRAALWQAMRSDKKNTDDTIRAAVPMTLGEGTIITLDEHSFLSLPA